ncbi:MAG: hypothetical protein ABII79_13485 [bacterium]
MTGSMDQTDRTPGVVDALRLDLSLLVGREVTLFSEQIPGKPLVAKVILVSEGEISVDRSGGVGLIDSLVSNQKVTLQVTYRGQQLSLPAILKRSAGGRCRVIIGRQAMPLSRRRFTRVTLVRPVRLAAMPLMTFSRDKLSRLRWLETETITVSGGGTMIDFNSGLENPTYLFMNIDLADFSFPPLVLGQVLYSLSGDDGHFNIGIEFVLKEGSEQRFPLTTLKQLPPAVMDYSEHKRIEVNERITAWMQSR